MSLETIKAKLAGLAVTPHGLKWLTQSLYPPGDLGRVAIPTMTHYPTLRMEYRPAAVVSRPGSVASGNWDLAIISLPWDSTALVWAAGPPGTDFGANPTVTAGYLPLQPNLATSTVPFSIVQRNAAGVASVNNNTFSYVRNAIQHSGFRLVAKSYTAHMTASDLYNGGSVTTCQYDTDWRPGSGYLPNGGRLQVPCLGSLPMSESEILQSSPYSVVGEAKEGVFVPHRLLGDFSFTKPLLAVGRSHSAAAIPGSAVLSDESTSSQVIGVVPALFSPSGIQAPILPSWFLNTMTGPIKPEDTGFGSMTSGISIFRGLNFEATITITAHVSLEYTLASTSPFRTMTTEPDEPDPLALKAYFEVAARMPHAYPASYNALGLVLPALGSAIKAALPYIPRVVGALAPVVKELWEKKERPPGVLSEGPALRRLNVRPTQSLPRALGGQRRPDHTAPVRSRSIGRAPIVQIRDLSRTRTQASKKRRKKK